MTAAIHTADGGALTVDPDVAEALAGHSWAPVAGRYIATVDNKFFDLQSLIGGPCAVPSPASPSDLRRDALDELHFEPAEEGRAARLSALRLRTVPEVRGIDVPQRPDVSAYGLQGERYEFLPMDAVAEIPNVAIDSLGLIKGDSYTLDFFSAERHVVQSNLLITTSLELETNPDIPIL